MEKSNWIYPTLNRERPSKEYAIMVKGSGAIIDVANPEDKKYKGREDLIALKVEKKTAEAIKIAKLKGLQLIVTFD
jgi:hypothetical protein